MLDSSPQDIALLVKGDGEPENERLAIERLRQSRLADVRVIAAQACIRNRAINAKWVTGWLSEEKNSEVRGYLYLSLPMKNKALARKVLSEISGRRDAMEDIYYLAAQSVAHGSRKYLIKVMEYIFSKSEAVSREAVSVCRMLVDEGDRDTLNFLKVLERERGLE